MSREISRYRAVMPREAWKNGQEPRERRRRRQAVDDLIAGLERYLDREGPITPVDDYGVSPSSARSWVLWAARLSDPYVRYGLGPAPDGSEWHINTRIEYL